MNVLQTITLNMQLNFQKWDIERTVILPIFHYIQSERPRSFQRVREIWSEYRNGFVTDIKEKLQLSKKTVDYKLTVFLCLYRKFRFFIKFSEKNRLMHRREILSVSRGKHNRGIEYSFLPFKTSIPIITFRSHSHRFRPNPKAIVLGGNEPFFIGERRLVAGVIHRQIKASLLANVQTDKAWCFGGGAGIKGIFQIGRAHV